MSARALTACRLEPTAERTIGTGHQAIEGTAAEIQFREDLWRAYRLEAINAGLSTSQATEYANALIPDMGRVVAVSEMTPIGRDWFYQSRASVVNRTIASGLITLTRRERRKTIPAAEASRLARAFRWWILSGKS
jgi:hypothetical protein